MREFWGGLTIVACLLLAACATPSLPEQQGSVFSIAVPDSGLILEFPSQGFRLEVADNKTPYYYLSNEHTKLNVSFSFERTAKCNSSESCRDYFANGLKAADASRKSWHISRIGDVFVSESMGIPAGDMGQKQRHMNAHFVKDGVWINVRLSKVDYQEADRELLVSFVRSIQFWKKS